MPSQMYVPINLQASKDELDAEINQLGDEFPTFELLVKVDYVYHHQDNSYDGGLSMLDRINAKLGRYRNNPWNIQAMKDNIRNALDPRRKFMETVESMIPTTSDVAMYGL